MPTGMVLLPLEFQKLMDGRNSRGIRAPNPYFAPSWPIDRFICNRRSPLRHHVSPWDDLRVHGERLREIAGAKRGLDVAHVRTDRGDGRGVTRVVAIQHDAPTVGQVLEHMCGGVLIDAHDVRAARLHGGEVIIRAAAADC